MAAAKLRPQVSGNEISLNKVGLYSVAGGQIYTMNNNVVRDNTTNLDVPPGQPFPLGMN